MKTQAITGTELQSSVFVLGTDGFSVSKTQAEAFAMMDGYLGLGGNHFDTAAIYPAPHLHQSEEIIGNYFTQRKNRSQVILATKGGHPPLGHMDVGRLTKKDLTEDLEKSLLALKTDYCDIYYGHFGLLCKGGQGAPFGRFQLARRAHCGS